MAQLVIVSGANGALGKAYLEQFVKQKSTHCIGLARTLPKKKVQGVTHLALDLLDTARSKRTISGISLKNVDKIVLVHGIGKFKFEGQRKGERPHRTKHADKEIWDSNVTTFQNLVDPLMAALLKRKGKSEINLNICAFGSVSDKFGVSLWASYTQAKNELRKIIKRMVSGKKKIVVC